MRCNLSPQFWDAGQIRISLPNSSRGGLQGWPAPDTHNSCSHYPLACHLLLTVQLGEARTSSSNVPKFLSRTIRFSVNIAPPENKVECWRLPAVQHIPLTTSPLKPLRLEKHSSQRPGRSSSCQACHDLLSCTFSPQSSSLWYCSPSFFALEIRMSTYLPPPTSL